MRLSQVSALNVARLGLNAGAKLWISFKLFSKQTFLKQALEIYIIKGLFALEKV